MNSIDPKTAIIIDNNSSDDTIQIIQREYPKAQVLSQKSNIGFAAANNIGIQKAYDEGAEYFFLLNHDAWIKKGTIERLIQLSKANPEFGILSPIHLNGSGELLDWNFTNYISNQEDDGRKLYTDLLLQNKLQKIYDANFVNAAAWLITRKCIEKVGLFDAELFPHYGEDLNFVQRVHYHGFKIGVVPDAFIYHDREERSGAHSDELNEHKKHMKFRIDGSNPSNTNGLKNMNDHLTLLKKRIRRERLKLNFKVAKELEIELQEKTELSSLIQKNSELYKLKGFGLE